MHYVGPSPVRKLQDLFMVNLTENKGSFKTSYRNESSRLEAPLWPWLPALENLKSDVKIMYHNARSLHLHYKEFLHEYNVFC